jgi:hypothetical protein
MQVEAFVYHRNADNTASYKYGQRLSVSQEWQKYTMSVYLPEVPYGYNQYFTLYIQAINHTIYSGSLWVDDVVIDCPDWDDHESLSDGMAGATAWVGSPYTLKDMPLGSDLTIHVARDEKVTVLDSVMTVGMYRQWDLVKKSDGALGWMARAHLFFTRFSCYGPEPEPVGYNHISNGGFEVSSGWYGSNTWYSSTDMRTGNRCMVGRYGDFYMYPTTKLTLIDGHQYTLSFYAKCRNRVELYITKRSFTTSGAYYSQDIKLPGLPQYLSSEYQLVTFSIEKNPNARDVENTDILIRGTTGDPDYTDFDCWIDDVSLVRDDGQGEPQPTMQLRQAAVMEDIQVAPDPNPVPDPHPAPEGADGNCCYIEPPLEAMPDMTQNGSEAANGQSGDSMSNRNVNHLSYSILTRAKQPSFEMNEAVSESFVHHLDTIDESRPQEVQNGSD